MADELSVTAAQAQMRAEAGLGTVGRLGTRAITAGLQMGADALLGGGSAMLPMLVRSFGGGAQEARQKGYDAEKQLALGLARAATEYFSERLFGGNPVYDSDVGLVNRLVSKVVGNPMIIRYMNSVPAEYLSEGLEEIVSDVLYPVAEHVIARSPIRYDVEEIIEDGAVGMLLAGIGRGVFKLGSRDADGAVKAATPESAAEVETIAETTGAEYTTVGIRADDALPSDVSKSNKNSGALSPASHRAEAHAARYYESIRKMHTDALRIASHTGFSVQVISEVKAYVFEEKHDLGEGLHERFAPCFEMAQSWQRLIEGKDIKPHDLTLLRHEIIERRLVLEGMTQREAHVEASKRYNYTKEAKAFYDQIDRYKGKR